MNEDDLFKLTFQLYKENIGVKNKVDIDEIELEDFYSEIQPNKQIENIVNKFSFCSKINNDTIEMSFSKHQSRSYILVNGLIRNDINERINKLRKYKALYDKSYKNKLEILAQNEASITSDVKNQLDLFELHKLTVHRRLNQQKENAENRLQELLRECANNFLILICYL